METCFTVYSTCPGSGEEFCDYCQGDRDPRSSDNPEKAIISLKNDRETEYKVYIAVQNELVAAYNILRNSLRNLYVNKIKCVI